QHIEPQRGPSGDDHCLYLRIGENLFHVGLAANCGSELPGDFESGLALIDDQFVPGRRERPADGPAVRVIAEDCESHLVPAVVGPIRPIRLIGPTGPVMNSDWQTRYNLAVSAAQEAGRVALKYFPDIDSAAFADQVIWKSDNSPVTIADRSAEQYLRETLLAAFPDDGFLGEEFGDHAGTSGYRWIVDPLAGTRNFVRGIPHWATLVGLEYREEVIVGVAVEPVLNMTYRALRGDGAYRNDRRIHVSPVNRLEDATMFYSS